MQKDICLLHKRRVRTQPSSEAATVLAAVLPCHRDVVEFIQRSVCGRLAHFIGLFQQMNECHLDFIQVIIFRLRGRVRIVYNVHWGHMATLTCKSYLRNVMNLYPH